MNWTRIGLGSMVYLWILPGVAPPAAQDAVPLEQVLAGVGKDASRLWGTAPDYVARETWRQKTIIVPSPLLRLQLSEDSPKPPEPREVVRETVSLYALGAFYKSPESLWEFRRVLSVDGKKFGDPRAARREFIEGLHGKDDKWRRKLRERFEKQGAVGTLFDFGQILLLFTAPRQQQYTFEEGSTERIGADNAVAVVFAQQLGPQSMRVHDQGKESIAPLKGEVLVREPNYGVLQVRVSAVHTLNGHKVEDNTTVDYADQGKALLPASVVHKRFVDGKTNTEDLFQYSDWENIRDPK